MQAVSENSLPELPVNLPAFQQDPFSFMDDIRRQHPWLATFDAGYVVHGYDAIKELAVLDDVLDPGFFGLVDFYDAHGTGWGRFMDEMLISASGERHKRLRNSVAAGFTPRRANQIRPMIQRIMTELLDEVVPKGEVDFVEVSADFPIAVMCGLLGVSSEPIPTIRHALEHQMSSLTFNHELKPNFLTAFDVLWNFADELVKEKESQAKLDEEAELDAMILAKNSGKMDETELRFMLMTFLLAGYDTSKNLLGMTLHTLLQHPDKYARCAVDKDYCRKVIEEMLRYAAIATPFRRVAIDFEYDGFSFKKGDVLAMSFPLAGRDPEAFVNANDFDPERTDTNRHVGFGRGAHMCIGQFIARNQLEEGLHLIAQRMQNPKLCGEVRWRPFLGAWGVESLPISFTPA